ncbi:MAG: class I mannose-6-phosphate isomerase [Armatimonadota bacterium]|nr:class I mannose-6-phosphate isomerase [Armatimonadota bacterium]
MIQGFDYPLLLEPIPVPRPWGGTRVCRLYNRPCAQTDLREPIGEWWDVSTWPSDPGNPEITTVNKILNGPLSGMPLDQVAEVPVVVKLLDSNEKLSVQVHPVSEEVHKDEMWYILHADPGAYLFCGFADGVDPKEFCELIRAENPNEDEVLSKLQCHGNLKPGAYFNVPTGTVHAVGPGLVAFEISERTQVTYRLFDYNRGRTLHLDEGCAAVLAKRPELPNLESCIDIRGADEIQTIAAFPTFCVQRVLGREIAIECARGMHLVTATAGDCRITGPTSLWHLFLPRASTVLLPGTQHGYTLTTEGEVLISSLRT